MNPRTMERARTLLRQPTGAEAKRAGKPPQRPTGAKVKTAGKLLPNKLEKMPTITNKAAGEKLPTKTTAPAIEAINKRAPEWGSSKLEKMPTITNKAAASKLVGRANALTRGNGLKLGLKKPPKPAGATISRRSKAAPESARKAIARQMKAVLASKPQGEGVARPGPTKLYRHEDMAKRGRAYGRNR